MSTLSACCTWIYSITSCHIAFELETLRLSLFVMLQEESSQGRGDLQSIPTTVPPKENGLLDPCLAASMWAGAAPRQDTWQRVTGWDPQQVPAPRRGTRGILPPSSGVCTACGTSHHSVCCPHHLPGTAPHLCSVLFGTSSTIIRSTIINNTLKGTTAEQSFTAQHAPGACSKQTLSAPAPLSVMDNKLPALKNR